MTNAVEKIDKLRDHRETMKKHAQAVVGPALKEFIKENPAIKTIMWVQYTPYFNDGDPCVFSVHGIIFCVNKLKEFDYEPEGGFEAYTHMTPDEAKLVSKETYINCIKLSKALRALEDELKTIFGDHCSVVVTEDGVNVEEYEHD